MADSSLIHSVVSTEAIGKPDVETSRNLGAVYAEPSLGWIAKRQKQTLLTAAPLAVADLVTLASCFLLGGLLASTISGWRMPQHIPIQLAALCGAYMLSGIQMGLFPACGMNPVIEMRHQVNAAGLAYLLLLTSNGILGRTTPNEVATVCLALPMSVLAMPVMRYAARCLCANQSWWGFPVIIIGAGRAGTVIYHFFTGSPTRGFRPVGVVDDDPSQYWAENDSDAPPFLGSLDELQSVCTENSVSSAIVVVSDRSNKDIRSIVAKASWLPDITILSSRLCLPSLWVRSCEIAGLGGVRIKDRLRYWHLQTLKRSIDVILAAMLLLLALPIILTAAIVLQLKSPGAIFYGHPRTGFGGRRFKAWKIRTMVPNSAEVFEKLMVTDPEAKEEWNQTHKLKNDPRIVGGFIKFLRKTSLDELPQLWNVLVGNMSLVGPRPLPDDELQGYDTLPIYFRVKPGLTGLWQISGRNNTQYEDKIRLDTYYIRNWSPWLDYYILLRTVRTVVMREGSY